MTNPEKSINTRIKWLLLAGTVFVAVSVFLLVWVPYQRQMRLLNEIEALRSDQSYMRYLQGAYTAGHGRALAESIGPEWLRDLVGDERMIGFDTVVGLDLCDTPVDDVWLRKLVRLSSLEELNLDGTQISDAGLKHLAGMTDLASLNLFDTPIGDDGLKHLAGFLKLRILYLGGTQISDEGLEHLTQFTNLEWLSLSRTQISDAGLKHLSGLSSLRVLFLKDTQVTDEGVKQLEQALPNCGISSGPK